MSFRRGAQAKAAPKDYVQDTGRGAAGFTTRFDVGPVAAASSSSSSSGPAAASGESSPVGVGSRSAELRVAKLQRMRQQQHRPQSNGSEGAVVGLFDMAPQNYVPDASRGAGMQGRRRGRLRRVHGTPFRISGGGTVRR